MNGQYQKLIDYIDKEKLEKINKQKQDNKHEFQFRVKNFFDKYVDNFINKIITDIKSCNIESVVDETTWNFSYKILATDIKILDPRNPTVAFRVVSAMFKKCCEILNVEMKKFTLDAQEGEDIYFTIYITNPLDIVDENDILEILTNG